MDMIRFRAICQSLCHFPSAVLFFWSLFSVSFSILTTRWYSNPQCSNCFYTMYWTLWIRKYNDRFLIHVSQISEAWQRECLNSGCCSVKYHRQRLMSKNNSFLTILGVRKGQGFCCDEGSFWDADQLPIVCCVAEGEWASYLEALPSVLTSTSPNHLWIWGRTHKHSIHGKICVQSLKRMFSYRSGIRP